MLFTTRYTELFEINKTKIMSSQIRIENIQTTIASLNNDFSGRNGSHDYDEKKPIHIHRRNRAFVWNAQMQESCLDSILKGYYIPPIICSSQIKQVGANGYIERREVMEGGNRITTFRRILNGNVRELTEEERASAARIGEGSFVSWNTSNGRAKGKVEKVVTKGQAKSSEGFILEATPDVPAFAIRIYKEQGNGWIPTDVVSVHRSDILTIITALPAPRSEDVSMIEERKTAIRSAERITMNAEVRAVATEDGTLKISGYAATFNNEATGLNFREVIAPGAFKRTLQGDNPIFLLVNHDMEQLPLASTRSGTLILSEDSVGLRMDATLDPLNPRAAELASALSRGDVDKMSFAFTVADGGDTRENGLRTLTDLDLYEVSVVNLPAYDATSVGLRSEQSENLDIRKRKIALKFKHYSLTK
jgi:HK97 family phage prohead protease